MTLARYISLIIGCVLFALAPGGAYGQQLQDLGDLDFTKVRVDDLTDEQIGRILQRAESEGISLSEMEKVALARGMRPSEVVKFRSRLREVQSKLDKGELKLGEDRRSRSYQRETDDEDQRRRRSSDEESDDPLDILSEDRETRDEDDRDTVEMDIYEELDSLRQLVADRQKLKVFGEDLFSSDALTFEPSLDIPTPQNYQVGAGDELIVDVWGSAQMTYDLPVGRDGTVRIESLGPVFVSGMTIEEAEKRILGRLGELYAGLNSSQPTERNIYADVTLGKVRSIRVHVVGEVTYPGTYTIPAVATVLNALYFCSGPNRSGTYREIQVIRGGSIITQLDVYDFLVYGRLDNNITLRDQDIIKVDPYIARVELTGEIKRPAIYELTGGETVTDLLRIAGSFTGSAYKKHLKLYRMTDTERRILTVNRDEFDQFELRNGDELYVDSLLKRFENRVEIRGAVFRKGDYQLEDAPTVYELIQKAEGLRGDAFRSRGQIYRTRDDMTLEVVSIDLNELMNDPENEDVRLKKDDVVVIPSIFDLKEERHIVVEGSVQQQGAYPYMDGMTLSDIIVMAGGLKEEASLERIEVSRRRVTDSETSGRIADIFYFDVDQDLGLRQSDQDFELQPFDEVFVRRSPSYIEQRNVRITGEIRYPGAYTIQSKNDRISSIIERAGGITPEAYVDGARLIRTREEMGPVGIDLRRILENPESGYDLLVEDGDSIHVPLRLETVKVSGAVYYPVSIRFSDDLSLMEYVDRAGGPTDQADIGKAYVVSASGSVDRGSNRFIMNRYPKIEPGAEIVVPTKPESEGMSIQEKTLVLSSIVSIAAVVSTTIFQLTR